MTPIRTILIDDEPRGLSSLQKMLHAHCPDIEIVALCENADDAGQKISQLDPALVFLDIVMPGKNGFDLLRELPDIDFEVVFITAHNNYMEQAFHFSAMDYLLKPVDEQLLKLAVQRIAKRISGKAGHQSMETFLHNGLHWERHHKPRICIPSFKGFQVVQLDDIIYCEGSGNYTNFHTNNGAAPICASRPIHEYESLLENSGFIRVHKSYLINLRHIREYQRGGIVILSNDFAVEVSRRKKEIFLSKMKDLFKS